MELFTGLIKSWSSQPLKEKPNFLTNICRENPLFPCSLKTWMVEIAHYTEKQNAVNKVFFFFPEMELWVSRDCAPSSRVTVK